MDQEHFERQIEAAFREGYRANYHHAHPEHVIASEKYPFPLGPLDGEDDAWESSTARAEEAP